MYASYRRFSYDYLLFVWLVCIMTFFFVGFHFRRERSSKLLLNGSSRVFLAAREKVEVLDSGWILWLVDARLLPVPTPPLEVTRRLEDRLSLGPPAELGREHEAIALLEELPYLGELRCLSKSPCFENQSKIQQVLVRDCILWFNQTQTEQKFDLKNRIGKVFYRMLGQRPIFRVSWCRAITRSRIGRMPSCESLNRTREPVLTDFLSCKIQKEMTTKRGNVVWDIKMKKQRWNLPAILSIFSWEGPAVNPGFAVVWFWNKNDLHFYAWIERNLITKRESRMNYPCPWTRTRGGTNLRILQNCPVKYIVKLITCHWEWK